MLYILKMFAEKSNINYLKYIFNEIIHLAFEGGWKTKCDSYVQSGTSGGGMEPTLPSRNCAILLPLHNNKKFDGKNISNLLSHGEEQNSDLY